MRFAVRSFVLVLAMVASTEAFADCSKAASFKTPGFCEALKFSHPFFNFNSRYAKLTNNQKRLGFPAGFYSSFNKVFNAQTGALGFGISDPNETPAQQWAPIGGGKYFNAAQQRTLSLMQTATGFVARYLDTGTSETYQLINGEYLLMSITDKTGAVTSMTRHLGLGLLLKITFPNSDTILHSYDAYGHLKWIEDTHKNRVNFTYSGLNTATIYPVIAVDSSTPKEDGTTEVKRLMDLAYDGAGALYSVNQPELQYRFSNGAMIYMADLNSDSAYSMTLNISANPAVRTELNKVGTTTTKYYYNADGQTTMRTTTHPSGKVVIEDFKWTNGEATSYYNRALALTATSFFTTVAAFPGLSLQIRDNSIKGTNTTIAYNSFGAMTSYEYVSGNQKQGIYRTLNANQQPTVITKILFMNGAVIYKDITTNTYDVNGSLIRTVTKPETPSVDTSYVWNGTVLSESIDNLSGGKTVISDLGNKVISTEGGGSSVQSVASGTSVTVTSRVPSGITQSVTQSRN